MGLDGQNNAVPNRNRDTVQRPEVVIGHHFLSLIISALYLHQKLLATHVCAFGDLIGFLLFLLNRNDGSFFKIYDFFLAIR